MNQEKLAKLQAQVRIGGKGTPRRKKKIVHRTATAEDKKLQSSLKKLVVQASLSANTFAVTGHAETKPLTELLPGILTQLGSDSLSNLRQLAQRFPAPRQGQ
ncbi:hypothetical protein CRUP_028740, partial [Coryphaenoides rupestris]